MTAEQAGGAVNARPTKAFFINMLVRDVPLDRAILDLVDNSVDGAFRSGGADADLRRFWVRLTVNKTGLQIEDNCGGISLEVARNYAFRVGRPSDAPSLQRSIGQFGVGMKRTIFKLGDEFEVASTTAESRFVLREQVSEWLKRDDEWSFDFTEVEDTAQPAENIGTSVSVTKLHPSVVVRFGLANFVTQLRQQIRAAHALPISQGLRISVNGKRLEQRQFEFLSSDAIRPGFERIEMVAENGSPVEVRLYCGVVKERELQEGGWYVFCNDRMVLEADQTLTTGWGQTSGKRIPQYHPDFVFFRGYAFFEAQDAAALPWTTTKTGLDTDSTTYRQARQRMVALMRPIIDYLRAWSAEKSRVAQGEAEAPLEDAMNGAEMVPYSTIDEEQSFTGPKPEKKQRKTTQRIAYERPKTQIAKMKEILGRRTSLKAIGEHTFDDFYRRECAD